RGRPSTSAQRTAFTPLRRTPAATAARTSLRRPMPTSHDHKTVLLAGATGRLGVLADVLLSRGHGVRAMTRNVSSPAAARLRSVGAEVVYGDFEDAANVEAAAAGAD